MIFILDNFFEPQEFQMVVGEIKKLKFYSKDDDKMNQEEDIDSEISIYPGTRTDAFAVSNPLLASFIVNKIQNIRTPFTNYGQRWGSTQHAYLRLEEDNKDEYIHQDQCDFAFLIYLSDTNLDSGTKMYLSVDEDKETCLVNFVQNRFVMYDANLPHSAYGNYGKDLSDGRLTINGFNSYI